MIAAIVVLLVWVVGMPVALALVARFVVASTPHGRKRATRVALWLIPTYFACVAGAMTAGVWFDGQGGADSPFVFGFCALVGAAPLVGVIIVHSVRLAQRIGDPDTCGSCGYSRQGAAGGICPECGMPWAR